MIFIIFWLFILIIFYNLYYIQESFNIIDYQDLKYNIIQNYNPITYVDKNSFNQFKTYISNILNQFGIEKKYFLKVIENNKYYLEIIIVFDDILKKLIEIELQIKNNKINIVNVNFKDNDQILLDGYDMNFDSNFLIPNDFSWKQNPTFQNIVYPNKTNIDQKFSADNLEELTNILKKNQAQVQEAIKMAEATLKNRESFYEQGLFGTKIVGIDNQRDCN